MIKKNIKILFPLLMVTLAVGSYLITKNNTLEKGTNMPINITEVSVENTIDIVQVRTLEGINGVSNLFYYDGQSNIIFGMNPDRSDVSDSKKDKNSTEYYRELYGSIYSSDISSINPQVIKANNISLNSLDADFGVGFSPNGNLVDFKNDKESYIFNISNNTIQKYSSENSIGNWTDDSNYIIKYGKHNDPKSSPYEDMFFVFSSTGKLIKSIQLPEYIDRVNSASNFHSINGDTIYFIARAYNADKLISGLFKLDVSDESFQSIVAYPFSSVEKIKNPGTDLKEHPGEHIEVYKNSKIYSFEFLKNGNIIYEAVVDNIFSLYMFDSTTKTSSLLYTYDGSITYSISPDQNKIVYCIDKSIKPGKNDTNVYVANIKDTKLTDTTLIKKDSFISSFKWSNDSKELIGHLPYEGQLISIKFK